MPMLEMMRNHIAYDWWANSRLLDAADALSTEQLEHDFGTADKSIKGTMLHIFRSSRTWLARIGGDSATAPQDDNWQALRGNWAELENGWTRWSQALTEEDLHRDFNYTDLKGRPWSQPVWAIVMHLVNHGTHHRGQVSGFLRASGLVPAPLDFIAYMRLKQRK